MNEATRAWIYRILTAVSVVVLFYGLASEEEVAMWVGVISSLIGNGLATANTSTGGSGTALTANSEMFDNNSMHSTVEDEGQSVIVVALIAAAVCLVMLLLLDVIHIG